MPDNQNKLTKFWHELKRRKVVGVIIVYATTAFILLQLVSILVEPLRLPPWTMTLLIIVLVIGFPIAVIFSWIFDVSSKGITKTEPEAETQNHSQPEPQKSAPDKSIIVLPFENISSDPEQEYFSDGLTEEIITDLSYINDLLVISRSSAMTFKGSKHTVKKIAEKVNVKYVLEGSVRKSCNNLRIVAQLIDAQSDTHLWAEKYNGTLDEIFDIQEKVSHSIAETLKIRLAPEIEKQIKTHPIKDTEVNDLYLKAKYDISSFSEPDLNRALFTIQNALDLDAENPYLLSLKGYAYFQFVNMGIKQKEHLELATEFANKALAIDPDSADANFTLGLIDMLNGNIRLSVKKLKKAHSFNPNDPNILAFYAWFCMILGKPKTAISLVEKVIESDPLNPTVNMLFGPLACFEGHYNKAVDYIEKGYRNQPNNPMIIFWYSLSLAYVGKIEESISIANESLKNPGQDIMIQLSQFLKCALNGDMDGISQLLTKEFIETSKRDGQISFHIACFYSYLGQKTLAIEWLENAVERDFLNYHLMNEIDPFLENIRVEKRFKELMKRVKKEWENFEV